jgi:predicted metal-dependent hydrolase
MPKISEVNDRVRSLGHRAERRSRRSRQHGAAELPEGTPVVQTSSPDLTVPTRRISFDEYLAELPKHFAGDGDLILSHLGAALSSVFPDGEDFFVRSVRHYRDRITDPVLKKQVAGFIGQESVHGREHRHFNDRLAELGYPTKRMEWLADHALRIRERVMPAESNLAATAALEHFTATLAELVLTSEHLREDLGYKTGRDLFVWHALEESEHKAVAFDVYKAIGGSEFTRVLTMKVARSGLIFVMAVHLLTSIAADRATYRPGVLRKSWKRFRSSPLMRREVWEQLKDYDRPDFHPNDSDTDELVELWREKLFGNDGELTDHLVGGAKISA